MIAVLDRVLLSLLFLLGFWGAAAAKNLIKKVFGLSIMNSSIVLLFVFEGSTIGNQTPILGDDISNVVDPIPQALMLTAIVIGVCVAAFALALAVRLYRSTGSLHIDRIKEKLDINEH